MITTTNRDYDLSEISKGVRGVLIGIAFVRRSFRISPPSRRPVLTSRRWNRCASCTAT